MEEKKCGRCGQLFLCQASNIAACGCQKVVLSARTREFLSKTRFDCLCNNCLTHYETTLKALGDAPLPAPADYQTPLHYYKDKGRFVFTEKYLILRGYCCQNGCRHCPYGFHQIP